MGGDVQNILHNCIANSNI